MRAYAPLHRQLALVLFVVVAGAPAWTDSPPAGYPDWAALSDVGVIEVLTEDADGDRRETKVWFVLLDGEPYLRTSRSRWLENLRRDPDLGLRIEGIEYQARAEEVTSDALIERVDRASREKYGWQEALIHVFRIRKPDILRLSPRPRDAASD